MKNKISFRPTLLKFSSFLIMGISFLVGLGHIIDKEIGRGIFLFFFIIIMTSLPLMYLAIKIEELEGVDIEE